MAEGRYARGFLVSVAAIPTSSVPANEKAAVTKTYSKLMMVRTSEVSDNML